jgi:hypothetical protein
MSHHHNGGGLKDPVQFGDRLCFCRSIHCKLFPVWRLARVMREPPGCTQPSRKGSREANFGRTTTTILPPDMACAGFGYPRFEPTWRGGEAAQTRVSSPSMLAPFKRGIKLLARRPQHRQSWTGRPISDFLCGTSSNRSCTLKNKEIGLFSFPDVPRDV